MIQVPDRNESLYRAQEASRAVRSVNHTCLPQTRAGCLHGTGRTGLVVVMHRMVFQDWDKEEAKA